jgi:hypothetical protein
MHGAVSAGDCEAGGVTEPLVTCIMPSKRHNFIDSAVACFRSQTYERKQLLILDGRNAESTGWIRNECCRQSVGEVIAHLDDDDWYSPTHLADMVRLLDDPRVMVAGYHTVPFYDIRVRRAWIYRSLDPLYLIGASMVYRRQWWESHPFPESGANKNIGEDWDFWMEAKAAGVVRATDGSMRMVARMHNGMTSPKTLTAPQFTEMPPWLLPDEFVKLEGITVKA